MLSTADREPMQGRPLLGPRRTDAVREKYFDVFFTAEVDKAEMVLSPAVNRFDVATVYEALKAVQNSENEG